MGNIARLVVQQGHFWPTTALFGCNCTGLNAHIKAGFLKLLQTKVEWGIVSIPFHKSRSSFPALGFRTWNLKVVEIAVEKILRY